MLRTVEGGIYPYLIPLARIVAGFMIGLMLAIFAGWITKIIYFMAVFPRFVENLDDINIVGVGLGAGLGAYVAWMTLGLRWYLIAGMILLVLGGGVLGAYLGFEYGKVIDPNYLGRRYTVDSTMHFGAAIGGITVATALGLFHYVKNQGR